MLSQVSEQKSMKGMFASGSAQPPAVSAGVYCRGTPGTEAGRP